MYFVVTLFSDGETVSGYVFLASARENGHSLLIILVVSTRSTCSKGHVTVLVTVFRVILVFSLP